MGHEIEYFRADNLKFPYMQVRYKLKKICFDVREKNS